MRKYLLLILVIFLTILSSCDGLSNDDGTKNCVPGYELVDGSCEKIIPECQDNEILVGDECVLEEENPDLIGPDYQFQDLEVYEGRDIVNDSCSHLENIGEWQPVWCDEFNYTGLPNSSLWGYDVGGHGWGNGESQYYTNADQDNAYVDNGVLTIKSIKESFNGSSYTSTRLISKNKGDFLYGKIQVRAKVPAGRGTWPAIWMLPTDWEYGGWPDSGEIDIMEYVGYDPNVIHGTIHTLAFHHSVGTQIGKSRTLTNVEEEFNVFEIEWEPNVICWYINGVQYFEVEYDPDTMYQHDPFAAWPFDKDFHLLLNTAIGGAWGGAMGIDESIFPVNFEIDYVRVYQKDYAGMDQEAPSSVTNIRTLHSSQSELFVGWDVAQDDVMVKEYEIYLNDSLVETGSHNGYKFTGLTSDTVYNIKIVPVDFAGNKGTPVTYQTSTDSPLTQNSRIEAENYTDMSGIQLENTTDTDGGQNVGWIDQGDYMTYVVEITESGNYVIHTRAASPDGSTGFEFYGNNSLLFTQSINATGGWQNWQTHSSTSVYLTAGTYTFKIQAIGGSFNINYFEFEKTN